MTESDHRPNPATNPSSPSRYLPIFWLIAAAVLVVWAANRLGAFDLSASVGLPDGTTIRLPTVYATVDHPFHATRAELLLRALRDGHPLRWVDSHQGGYPVEFYPLGVAGFEVGLWALFLGTLPIIAIHKLAVILILLAPGAAYLLAAKRDRLSFGVGAIALAAHVVVRGWWWSGGSYELVEWGLVTNVAAAVAALFVLVLLTSFLEHGRCSDALIAAGAGAFCLYANPRSGIALAVAGIGGLIAVLSASEFSVDRLKRSIGRLALVAAAVATIAAPEVFSLIRFQDLYYFVRYEQYANFAAYWHSSIQAVSGPVFLAGLSGIIVALIVPGRTITRAFAVTLILYGGATTYLSAGPGRDRLVEQLETTRLMPFQRLLLIFLAAVAVYDLSRWLLGNLGGISQVASEATLLVVMIALPVLYVLAPPSWIPAGDRGLVSVPTAASPAIGDLREAVQAVDRDAQPGTALLVLGSTDSWHANLWAPLWSDRPFFYDDWLWDWQTKHAGPYNPLTEHAYRPSDMAEVLSPDYLSEHAIGAILIAKTARTSGVARAIGSAPNLERSRSGVYDVYLVRNPATTVTIDGANAEALNISDGAISANVASGGGTALIRRTWFPRWRATVNGEAASITQTADGYMAVDVPAGEATIEVTYIVDDWDWLGRILCIAGLTGSLVYAVEGRVRPRVRSGHR